MEDLTPELDKIFRRVQFDRQDWSAYDVEGDTLTVRSLIRGNVWKKCLSEFLFEQRTMRRSFGGTTVHLYPDGKICVQGPWLTNWGIVYPHYIERFKSAPGNVEPRPQVIGMDSSIAAGRVTAWIYSKIYAGKMDHLTEGVQ